MTRAVGDARAEPHPAVRGSQLAQLGDPGQVEQRRGPAPVEVQLDHHVGAAGDRHRAGVLGLGGQRLGPAWSGCRKSTASPGLGRRGRRREHGALDQPVGPVGRRGTPRRGCPARTARGRRGSGACSAATADLGDLRLRAASTAARPSPTGSAAGRSGARAANASSRIAPHRVVRRVPGRPAPARTATARRATWPGPGRGSRRERRVARRRGSP